MGLDMYLYKKNYIWSGEWVNPEAKQEVIVKTGGEVDKHIKPERVKYVVEEVAYWRKANSIHKWFVDNCQDGVDDCRNAYVDREKLEELLDLCKQVKADPDKAHELLPTQSGFFFGSTQYDEWYFEDINNTIEMLEGILSDETGDEFEYHSSW